MSELSREIQGPTEPCVYLPERQAQMSFHYLESCSAETYQDLLERGWRRFGRGFFRPVCAGCQECRSLRVVVADFQPDRSMRRTLVRNQDLQVLIGRPSLSRDHLDLYRRYHADMAERRGWPGSDIDPRSYFRSFVEGYESFGFELLYVHQSRLLGVALVDVLPRAVSAVYCYYDPAERRRALGVFSILQQVELARQQRVPHLYLGFLVAGNASMRYKARYRPYEILRGRPATGAPPHWCPEPAS